MPEAVPPTMLCDAVAVAAEAPTRVEHDGTAYAVFLVGNRHYVTQDACTHGPGSLAEGTVDRAALLRTAARLAGAGDRRTHLHRSGVKRCCGTSRTNC